MPIKKSIFRIMDANFNRSREGLRVCEDIARFMMNSPDLTKELKTLRHGISGIIKSSPEIAEMLIEARDIASDVGRLPDFGVEVPRRRAGDIFIANIERVKESVRVLEEFFKLIDIKLSARLSRIRFKVYAVEKKAAGKLPRKEDILR